MKVRRCPKCGAPVLKVDGYLVDDRPEWRGVIHGERLCKPK